MATEILNKIAEHFNIDIFSSYDVVIFTIAMNSTLVYDFFVLYLLFRTFSVTVKSRHGSRDGKPFNLHIRYISYAARYAREWT